MPPTDNPLTFGHELSEADALEQQVAVDPDAEAPGYTVSTTPTWDANPADLIDQAIEVPLADDDDW